MVYRFNIPALTPLPQETFQAPAVVADSQLDLQNLYDAFYQYSWRILHHLSQPQNVTVAHVGDAFVRVTALSQMHSAETYSTTAGAPAWVQILQHQMQQMQQQLQQSIDRLSAQMWNQQAATFNVWCVTSEGGQTIQLRRFRKTVAGTGNHLPVIIAPAQPRALPPLNVGDLVPNNYFPTNLLELYQWNLNQIDDLSRLLNQDFDIVAQDNLAACREKLRRFLAN